MNPLVTWNAAKPRIHRTKKTTAKVHRIFIVVSLLEVAAVMGLFVPLAAPGQAMHDAYRARRNTVALAALEGIDSTDTPGRGALVTCDDASGMSPGLRSQIARCPRILLSFLWS
jgi:hypothetical protein